MLKQMIEAKQQQKAQVIASLYAEKLHSMFAAQLAPELSRVLGFKVSEADVIRAREVISQS